MSDSDKEPRQANEVTAASAGTGSSPAGSTTEIERDAAAAKQSAGNAVEEAKRKAGELGEQAKQAARDAADDAGRQARSFAEDQKEEVAGSVGGVADALRSAAGSLDDQNQPAFAGYARQAASGLEQVSDAISRRNVDDLVDTVEDFARRQPVAFLGGAVLAGFVMARFAKSSADRRRSEAHRHYADPARNRASHSDGYNPVGMAPENPTRHRFADTSNTENR